MTIFDRYLLRRFIHVFAISLASGFGLFVVIDGFTNVDGFQQANEGRGVFFVLLKMAEYYACHSVLFFERVGPFVTVIAVMVVFGLLQRHSELQPVLAAGIPTYRLAVPLVAGALVVNVLLTANRELVIPRISHLLKAPRGDDADDGQDVEPVYDFETHILISGKELFLANQKLKKAEFVLPVPDVAQELTTLKAAEALFYEGGDETPTGWLLRDVQPRFDNIHLTKAGRRTVLPRPNEDEVFVVTDVSFDQLHDRNAAYRFLSTSDLMRRIRNPAFGVVSIRGQTLHLHQRLTRPLMNLIAVLIAVPLVVRKESKSLVLNMATCTFVLGLLFVNTQVFLYLAKVNLISPDLAVWIPIIINGTLAAALAGLVQS